MITALLQRELTRYLVAGHVVVRVDLHRLPVFQQRLPIDEHIPDAMIRANAV
jgi:hypothetical protein